MLNWYAKHCQKFALSWRFDVGEEVFLCYYLLRYVKCVHTEIGRWNVFRYGRRKAWKRRCLCHIFSWSLLLIVFEQVSFQLNGHWKSSLYKITSHINVFQWQNVSGRCHYYGLSIVISHSYCVFLFEKKNLMNRNTRKKNIKTQNTMILLFYVIQKSRQSNQNMN